MKSIPMEPELQALIDEYHRVGGVIEYRMFELEQGDIACEQLFRQAAIETVRMACPSGKHDLTLANSITGKIESGHTFLGPYWSGTRKTLLVHGQSPNLNYFFYANDEEKRETAIDLAHWVEASGYAYAFSEPPYKLQCPNKRKSELFVRINNGLVPFGMDATGTIIYSWPTNWSSYFDAGREWWGEYLWTVWYPGRRVLGITASTTD